jgi:hypothetical protein
VIVTIERTRFKVRHVAFIEEVAVERPDAVARPVRLDQRVRSPRVWLFREPTTLFFWGSYKYLLAGS